MRREDLGPSLQSAAALCSSMSNWMAFLLSSHMPISRAASELFLPFEYCLAQTLYTILWKFISLHKTAGCCLLL